MRDKGLIRVQGAVRACGSSAPYIEFSRARGCSGCAATGSCGSALLSGALGAAEMRRLGTGIPLNCRPGDVVDIEIPAPMLVRLTAIAYLGPALLMLCGGWIGAQYLPPGGDAATLVGAAGGLLTGYAVVAVLARLDRFAAAATPRIRSRKARP
jgi:positive regulator of sigma E activity